MMEISLVAAELDAAHERARRAYAARDLGAYMDTFHPSLEYRQRDGRIIDRVQLAGDVRGQLQRVGSAVSEFRRTALAVGADGATVTEEGEQEGSFEVRAFGILRRVLAVRRRGRYEWVRSAVGWQVRRAEVLDEEITSRVTLAFGLDAPAA